MVRSRIQELGRKLTMFAVAAIVIGVVGAIMGAGDALRGEWTGYAAMLVGFLGIMAGSLILAGSHAGSALNGMNLGVFWAVLNLPYFHSFNRETGENLEYPLPAFGAIFTMGSSTSVNGEVVREDVWGIGFIGVILIVAAITARTDWNRMVTRQVARDESAPPA